MQRVLIIDDDSELCELVGEYLKQEGWTVDGVYDGTAGIAAAGNEDYQLIILDVMLPGANGFDVLRQIRTGSDVPVIMLTARGEDVDRIVGLEIGADDYIPKPFNPRELVARMRAILRRVGRRDGSEEDEAGVVVIDDLRLDMGARMVWRADEEIRLTGIELSLLEVLVRMAGQVVSRDELSRQALGRRASSLDRSLDVHISNLRRKLGPLPGGQERIKTVRAVGYQYVKPAEHERTGSH
jgi:two-component system response regulator CpxR